MNCAVNQNLTPEKYQEIKTKLENENLESFPSVFQQARNLAKQAWLSGVDVAKGKPLLSTAEKANERIKICEGCEFYKENRCLKCGCFMAAKIHVESSRCPINKWGPELQVMNSPEQVNAAMTRVEQPAQNVKQNELPRKQINPTNLSKQSPEEIWVASTINSIVAEMNKRIDSPEFEARFPYRGNTYMVKKIKPATPVTIAVDKNSSSNFNDLVKKHSNPSEPKTFDFNNEQYFVDVTSNKNEPLVFKINKEIMQHAFSPVLS